MQSAQFSLDAYGTRLVWLHGYTLTRNNSSQIVICADDLGKQTEGAWFVVLVSYLRLHMYYRLALGNIKIGSIDISTCRPQITIKW